MEKIKNIFKHFIISEFLVIIGFFFVAISLKIKSENTFDLIIYIYIYIMILISLLNLFLAIIFYYLNKNISIIMSIIIILILCFIIIYLFQNKNYYESLSLDKYPNSFMRENIGKVLIFLVLIINQLLVRFYLIIWNKLCVLFKRKMKK